MKNETHALPKNELLEGSKIAQRLYEKHINTERYKMIVESLDQNHPAWRNNDQLGRCAIYLINFAIKFTEAYRINPSDKNWQADIKLIIDFDYDFNLDANKEYYMQDIQSIDSNELINTSVKQINNIIYWPY